MCGHTPLAGRKTRFARDQRHEDLSTAYAPAQLYVPQKSLSFTDVEGFDAQFLHERADRLDDGITGGGVQQTAIDRHDAVAGFLIQTGRDHTVAIFAEAGDDIVAAGGRR